MKIAFDVDDTLIIPSAVTGARDVPNYDTIALYKWFQAQGHTMIIWSGSGVDWAQAWNEKLGLQCHEVRVKAQRDGEPWPDIDICFDDCDVNLAKMNIKVKRIENSVSRKEWNATKRLDE